MFTTKPFSYQMPKSIRSTTPANVESTQQSCQSLVSVPFLYFLPGYNYTTMLRRSPKKTNHHDDHPPFKLGHRSALSSSQRLANASQGLEWGPSQTWQWHTSVGGRGGSIRITFQADRRSPNGNFQLQGYLCWVMGTITTVETVINLAGNWDQDEHLARETHKQWSESIPRNEAQKPKSAGRPVMGGRTLSNTDHLWLKV